MEGQRMKYRVTALTPLLVSNGEQLSPIDYMVYKDQVSVLDQNRIFRLLAKGPRLEGYLTQLRRADKLDFASWGGFAQNFASHRIPFEHESAAQAWAATRVADLFIPTFNSSTQGPYIPGSALKGALRTGYVFTHANPNMLENAAASLNEDRPNLWRVADEAEHRTAGNGQSSRMRPIMMADSSAISREQFKVYLVRTAKLEERTGKFGVSFKPTPVFAEMASPGTQFEGMFGGHNERFHEPEVLRALRWKEPISMESLATSANKFAAQLLEAEKLYAERSGLTVLAQTVAALNSELASAGKNCCLLPLGWGGGFLSKVGFGNPESSDYRKLLRAIPFYQKAVQTGLPFPKTRKIVHVNGQPAALPGWVKLEILS